MNNYFEDEYYYNGEKIIDTKIIDFLVNGYGHFKSTDGIDFTLKSNVNKKFKYNVGDTVAVINNGLFHRCTIIGRKKYIEVFREDKKVRGVTIATINTFEEHIKYVVDAIWSTEDMGLVNEENIIPIPVKVVYENKMCLVECNPSVKLDIKPFNMTVWNSLDKPPETFTVKDCSVEFTAEDPYISKRLRELIENKPERKNNKMKAKYKIGDRVYYIFNNMIHPVEIYDIYIDGHTFRYRVVNMCRNENGEFYVKEKKYWQAEDVMNIPEVRIIGKVDEPFMPNITDYTYNPDTATTTITWSDNTTTKVTAESLDEADQYTGFMTAYAKKAAGNSSRIQSIYERALKLPEKKAFAEQKAKEQEEEQRKIRENQKARKRRQRIRREARRRKEQYEKTLIMDEAKRLAEKEYGVPYEQSDWLKQNEGNAGNDKT